MSKVVFINGAPATGKSTLVALLRKQGLKCPIVGKDDIKETLFQTTGLDSYSNNKQLNQAAFAIMYRLLEEHARASSNLIVEANSKPRYDNKILKTIHGMYPFETLQIMLECSGETMLQRDVERRASGERNAGHTPMVSAEIPHHKSVVGFFDIPSRKMTWNTQGDRSVYDSILERIEAFLG